MSRLRRDDSLTALVERSQAGDLVAFDRIVRGMQDMAVAYAASMLGQAGSYAGDGHRDLASDAVQEAFLEAYRDIGQLRDTAAFAAWLRRIVHKQCDRLTRRKQLRSVPLDAAAHVAASDPGPHELLELQIDRERIRAALASLPQPERTALLMYHAGENSYADIAGFMGIPLSTVRARLHSARKRLRADLQDERTIVMTKKILKDAAPSVSGEMADHIALHLASKAGDLNRVRALLDARPEFVDRGAPDGMGRFAPLHYAARYGHTEVVRELLNRGAEPAPFEHMLRNHMGTTTRELARLRGFDEIVRLLDEAAAAKTGGDAALSGSPAAQAMRRGDYVDALEIVRQTPSNIEASDNDGNRLLHRMAALRQGSLDTLAELVDLGASLSVKNALGFTPVDLTIWRNHLWSDGGQPWWEGTKFFLSRGAEYTINIASCLGDADKVAGMLAEAPDLAQEYQDGSGRRPLSCAAFFNHLDIVRILLEHGADPNAKEADPYRTFPLVAAATHGNMEMVELLLKHGADPNAEVNAAPNAMQIAMDRGHRAIADLLAASGAFISVSSWAWRCDLPTLSSILQLRPDLAQDALAYNDDSKPDQSALVLKLAFHHGTDPAKVGHWTMYRAIDTPKLLRTFLSYGVDPNSPDAEGKTLLHGLLARWPKAGLESAAMLLDHGADINARDDVYEATPLAWAAMFGNAEMVDILLSRGASINLPGDSPWSSPLFWAESKGHTAIAKRLRRESGEG